MSTACTEANPCGSTGAIIADTTSFALTNVAIGLPCLVVGVCGIIIAAGLIVWILRQDRGTKQMQDISDAIQVGAKAFLRLEYIALAVVVSLLFVLVSAAINWRTGICYISGSFTSMCCGYTGMMVATSANSRTTQAAKTGLNAALRVSFNSGCVMGLVCTSAGLGAISILLMAFGENAMSGRGAMTGFGFGTSTVAIFARVGGGIFTKAADVGADLVGKNMSSIPEDDLRNPATIADNVGDNVGDVAGMGADLLSSFVGSGIASALLGVKVLGQAGVALPYWVYAAGIVASMIAMLTVRCEENATQGDLLAVLQRAILIASLLEIGFIAVIVHILKLDWRVFGAVVIGLAAGFLIGRLSGYFTSDAYPPVQSIAESAKVTSANVIISGLSVGMLSTVMPSMIVASVLLACLELAGTFGVAMASTGLLSTLGITLATDAYGPVADNAGGIAEMCHLEEVRSRTDILDALGNTTAAVGKGFAVGSAVLTAVSLLTNFVTRVEVSVDAITNKRFIAGVLYGGMLPFWFSGMCMGSVNVAAKAVVVEVIHQWKTIDGLQEGRPGVFPNYDKCVTMITKGALHAMAFPAGLPIITPLIFGIGLGPAMLAGVVLGALVGGFMLGGMMSTSGGAWDNAKKFIEAGNFGGKRSAAHKSAVVGDTVGDPFKDTAGPALNIFMKLMAYISVTMSPVFKKSDDIWWVALIVIGVLIVFVPWWISVAPAGVRDEVYNQLQNDLDKEKGPETAAAPAAAATVAAPAPAAANATNGATDQKAVEMQALSGAYPAQQPTPTSGRAVTIHFAEGFLNR